MKIIAKEKRYSLFPWHINDENNEFNNIDNRTTTRVTNFSSNSSHRMTSSGRLTSTCSSFIDSSWQLRRRQLLQRQLLQLARRT
jgi:hypothetical protein